MLRVGLVIDTSKSMYPLRNQAKEDFNTQLSAFKDTDCLMSVVECGRGYYASVNIIYNNMSVKWIQPKFDYPTDGSGTPLWDSIMKTIEILDNYIGVTDPKLVEVITDGVENRSKTTASQLMNKIKELQNTDMWTFVFRVPRGSKQELIRVGIPEGNIMEWDQTEESLNYSSRQTAYATQSYLSNIAMGRTSTNKFYTDLSGMKPSELKQNLKDITDQVRSEAVWSADDGIQIRDFCIKHFGEFEIGRAYYQLMKPEKVQDHKNILIKHKKKGRYYGDTNSEEVRVMLALPTFGEIKVIPGNHGDYEIYVQSKSVNRKLLTGTKVLYKNVG